MDRRRNRMFLNRLSAVVWQPTERKAFRRPLRSATKMKKAADRIDLPKQDDQLLSPYRDDPDS